jgi:phosphoribosyl-ATP pyrophosphohydrolase/phosphoribosyl-AMP cyclohydrolase
MKINDLIPAIVQDYYSGQVLMLAYVNQQSYDYMLKHGETCFWSRSRNELWHKGATSGDIQKIKSIAFDCDNDTMLIQVQQTGKGACHLGRASCFGDDNADYCIINKVFAAIDDRAKNPVEKSYTSYLLTEGQGKVCKKIGEESAETIIAAIGGDSANLAGEIGDLAFHLLVLMYQNKISPTDLRALLATRHQTKGNLKPKKIKTEN